MFGYIYKTTNLINHKIYVGQHKHPTFDPDYIGSGKAIKNAIAKYGFNNFSCEILEECESAEALDCREIYWIEQLHSRCPGVGYNITTGGNGTHGYTFTDEVKQCIRENTRYNNITEIHLFIKKYLRQVAEIK